jgi:hypothetical protein
MVPHPWCPAVPLFLVMLFFFLFGGYFYLSLVRCLIGGVALLSCFFGYVPMLPYCGILRGVSYLLLVWYASVVDGRSASAKFTSDMIIQDLLSE